MIGESITGVPGLTFRDRGERGFTLLYVGLTHDNAPLNVRERTRPSPDQQREMLDRLGLIASGRMVLSTCERFEVYAATACQPADRWIAMLADWFHLPRRVVSRYARVRRGEDAASHLLRVAAGLESRVVGEPQVLGQVRQAYAQSLEANALSPALAALGRTALRAGRRARHETPINRSQTSIATIAVDELLTGSAATLDSSERMNDSMGWHGLTRRKPGRSWDSIEPMTVGQTTVSLCETVPPDRQTLPPDGPPERAILIVGSGRMAGDVLAEARSRRAGRLIVVARNLDRATDLAVRFGATVMPLARLAEAMATADGVIVCTSAPGYVVDATTIGQRRNRALAIIDLCVPRNVDPVVEHIAGVQLTHLDALLAKRKDRADGPFAAMHIVNEELANFLAWCRCREAAPLIVDLIQQAQQSGRATTLENRRMLHEQIMRIKSQLGVRASDRQLGRRREGAAA